MRRLVAVLALTLVACGGEDAERVLHLRTGDYTEAEFRAKVRASAPTETQCRTIRGLSTEEILAVLEEGPTRGAIVQTPDHDDDLRQAEIIREECARMYD